jgi:hypothetical protein
VVDVIRAYFRTAGVTASRDIESGVSTLAARSAGAAASSQHAAGFSLKLIEETAEFFDATERNASICFSCESLKGIRVKHCPFCDRCVDRMDHHWSAFAVKLIAHILAGIAVTALVNQSCVVNLCWPCVCLCVCVCRCPQ